MAATSSSPSGGGAAGSSPASQESTSKASTPDDSSNNNSSGKSNAAPWMTALPIPQITITLYIPTQSVGAVIGRKGATIAQIQRQAGQPVRISIVSKNSHHHHHHHSNSNNIASTTNTEDYTSEDPHHNPHSEHTSSLPIPQETQPNNTASSSNSNNNIIPFTLTPLEGPSNQWTPVVIRAEIPAALFVVTSLQELVNGGSSNNAKSNSSNNATEVIMDLPIPRARHATLVGKRGTTLMQLSANTQTRIYVPPRGGAADSNHTNPAASAAIACIVQLEAPLQNCIQCLKAMSSLLSSPATGTNVANATATDGDSPSASQQQQQHYYPHQAMLVVQTLPSQTKLRTMGRKTDTMIKKKKLASENSWQLTIMGNTEAQVQNAVAQLTKQQQQQSSSSGNGGGGGRGGGAGRGGGGRGKAKGGKRGGGNNNYNKPSNHPEGGKGATLNE